MSEAGFTIRDSAMSEPILRLPADLTPEQARVYAAAPDLLAALKAVEWAGEIGGWPLCEGFEISGHLRNCQIGAALRKAEGW